MGRIGLRKNKLHDREPVAEGCRGQQQEVLHDRTPAAGHSLKAGRWTRPTKARTCPSQGRRRSRGGSPVRPSRICGGWWRAAAATTTTTTNNESRVDDDGSLTLGRTGQLRREEETLAIGSAATWVSQIKTKRVSTARTAPPLPLFPCDRTRRKREMGPPETAVPVRGGYDE